ncbi:MAG: CAAD domain-containing protein [Nostoc sp. S4]|nr:CAAD domain-containing protein [Nostoc sp. S4]
MESQQQQIESINPSSLEAKLALEGTNTTNLPKLPPAPESQWQKISRQVSEFFEQLPEYLSSFFKDYKQPLITVGLILTALVTVKVTLAVLDAIHHTPLLSTIFELIGIAYTTWFIFRYLLRVSNRQELVQEIRLLKNQIVGE